MSNPSPTGIVLRSAVRTDDPFIRAMVHSEHLNPIGLNWKNFLVAEDAARRIVGIGAVKSHGDGSRELASIAVLPEWRRRGVASTIIRKNIERTPGPLFLTCRDSMTGFYEAYGFQVIGVDEMTPYFKRLYRLISGMAGVLHLKNTPRVMKRS